MSVPTNALSIGEVADRTGLSVHTLRFYEQEDLLLGDVARDDGGRRRYGPDDVGWIEVVTKLRASGMPLADVRRFAQLVRRGPGNEAQRLELLREHQRRVTAQLDELRSCLELISWKVEVYDRHLADGAAGVLWTGAASDAAG